MSWLDKINNVQLTIVTGDGKEWKPKWINAQKNLKYNTEGFDFVGVDGSYVSRGNISGTQYPIELYFEGETCIDDTTSFEISARDKRPWTVKHPLYDDILCHPIELNIDNSVLNISKVTGTIWETIPLKYPQEGIQAEAYIESITIQNLYNIGVNYEDKFTTGSVAKAGKATNGFYTNYNNLPNTNEQILELKDKARVASGAATDLLSYPLRFIESTQDLINFPSQLAGNVYSKLVAIENGIDNLISTLAGADPADMLMFEAIAQSSLSIACQTAGMGDYATRRDVVDSISKMDDIDGKIKAAYEANAYINDGGIALDTDVLYQFTIAQMYNIAFTAKQERSIYTDTESNMVVLAHRFYGAGDENLQKFIDNNQITLKEHLRIKKGRKIVWYV